MKTGNAALIIAAGILLLWVVTSNRTQNLAASWAALLGAAPKNVTGTAGAAVATAAPASAISSLLGPATGSGATIADTTPFSLGFDADTNQGSGTGNLTPGQIMALETQP